MDGTAFSPDTLTVKRGDTAVWFLSAKKSSPVNCRLFWSGLTQRASNPMHSAITPEAWEATDWTMVSIDTSNSLRWHTAASQIDDGVAARLRAANENVAVGRFVERLRSVDDRPRN